MLRSFLIGPLILLGSLLLVTVSDGIAQPSVLAVRPLQGSGPAQTFTFTFHDQTDVNNFIVLNGLFTTLPSTEEMLATLPMFIPAIPPNDSYTS